MNQEALEVCKDLVSEIGRAKSLTSDLDMQEVFLSAETIIGLLAYLIKPKNDLEHEYHVQALKRDGESQSQATARAKASEVYRDWRKLSDLYDLAHEQVMLLKKFKEEIAMEHQRT